MRRGLWMAALCWFPAACGDDTEPRDARDVRDGEAEIVDEATRPDVDADVPGETDGAPDGEPEAEADGTPDGEPEAEADGTPEVEPDVEPDAPDAPETSEDAAVDGGAEGEAEVDGTAEVADESGDEDVVAAPTITVPPADQTVIEGETATFSVVAAGPGTLTYQWRRGGADISGAAGADYTTPTTTLADDGAQFAVAVSNGGGTVVSGPATLSVNPLPAYAHTIVIDGINDFTAGERFSTSSAGYTAYIAWDATFVYVGMSGPDVASGNSRIWLLVYVGGSPGSGTGLTYNTQAPILPFVARWHVRWQASNVYTNAQAFDGSGWSDAGWDFSGDVYASGSYVELRIPRSDVGNPADLELTLFMINETSMSEWTYAGVGNGFVDGYNPAVQHYFAFHLAGSAEPNAYVPL